MPVEMCSLTHTSFFRQRVWLEVAEFSLDRSSEGTMNPNTKISSTSASKGEVATSAPVTETTSLLSEKKKKILTPYDGDGGEAAMLSDDENIEEILAQQQNRWWKSSSLTILPLLVFFLFVIWWTNSVASSTSSSSSLILKLHDQKRVYFKTSSGNYLRIDPNGTATVTDSSFPWITGSTFRIELNPSSPSHCWRLRSRGTGFFVGLDQKSKEIIGNVKEKNALCFQASRIAPNSTSVNIKELTLNRWLSLVPSQNDRGPTLILVDSIPSSSSQHSDSHHRFEIEPIPLLQGVNLGGMGPPPPPPLLLPPSTMSLYSSHSSLPPQVGLFQRCG
jgi:hypothetical protein